MVSLEWSEISAEAAKRLVYAALYLTSHYVLCTKPEVSWLH